MRAQPSLAGRSLLVLGSALFLGLSLGINHLNAGRTSEALDDSKQAADEPASGDTKKDAAPLKSKQALEDASSLKTSYARWTNGPPAGFNFFPITVWCQSPANAARYRQAGFNTYLGLWHGPTEQQLDALKQAGLKVICEQNDVGLRHLNDSTIIGWMHGDEPDNAQARPGGLGYGPPILPSKITADYQRLVAADPSRPVLLNLGQGVAWDRWHGRGTRTNHPEDYPEYIKGGDIISFDIYPANHDHRDVAGRLEFVGRGVERLIRWGQGEKIIWNCIECSAISDPKRKPTPQQVRCEAWMSLVHGSQGLIYFVHQFKPVFREAALFDDPIMLKMVTSLNHQIIELAPVLNSPSILNAVTVRTSPAEVPVALMVKRQAENIYLFAVSMQPGTTQATFSLQNSTRTHKVEVLGEDRVLTAKAGMFTDQFASWDAHIYRITATAP